MRQIVKVRANGEDHYAMWSSVVMGTITEYMPKKAMARWLKREYPSITKGAVTAALESAVHEERVGWT